MLNPQEKTTLEIQPSINSRNEQEIKGRKQIEMRITKMRMLKQMYDHTRKDRIQNDIIREY